jgi:hypothetical protein
MTITRTVLTAATLAAALAGLTACGGGTGTDSGSAPSAAPQSSSAAAAPSSAAPAAATGTLEATDQTSDGTSVTVDSVSIDAGGMGGWIALHQDADGKPGPVKYFVQVPAGASTDVAIPTPEGITTGAYWPMLHVDDGEVGTYEFPQVQGADLPAKADGMIVMKMINVTVQ